MHSEAPGKKIRRNKDGSKRILWIARADLVKAGYRPKIVRLHYNDDDPGDAPLIAAACRKLQSEMLAWASGLREHHRVFDGTIESLVRLYQTDKASPYLKIKWNTRRTYNQILSTIERAFGKRCLSALKIGDFVRWYDEAKKPKFSDGRERVRKAHGIITMLRRLFKYGIMAELPECQRLATIIAEARFTQPGRRRTKLDLKHVLAFVPVAIESGRLSLALGTSLQFETTLRQRDVIGEWEPISDSDNETGIMLNGRRWGRGLTWSDISADLVLVKETTKTGSIVSHDLKLCPIVMRLLAHVPSERRVGPVIIDEESGRPYAEHAYAREWRVIARAAGIPDDVWNMDARSGGISEADDAGADLDAIRAAAGHSQTSTTVRYVRGTIGKSREVAKLRQAHREAQNKS